MADEIQRCRKFLKFSAAEVEVKLEVQVWRQVFCRMSPQLLNG